mgnify:CR=1 FL=1
MKRIIFTTVTLSVAGTLLLASPAFAREPAQTMATMVLIGSDAQVGIVDNSPAGASPGDVRTLSVKLAKTNGTDMGEAQVVETLTRHVGTLGTAVKLVVLDLPQGTITATGHADYDNFTSFDSGPNEPNERLTIIGGSGPYRGATGQVDVKSLPDLKSRWTIVLNK